MEKEREVCAVSEREIKLKIIEQAETIAKAICRGKDVNSVSLQVGYLWRRLVKRWCQDNGR